MVINNPGQWQVHWDYAKSGLGMSYPRYSPLHWRTRWDFAPHGLGSAARRGRGLGMIFPKNQNWQTSRLPFSLALANRINTGVSFNTPSNAIAESQRWARRGFQGVSGYGPRIQYPIGAGMDGLGCGCGCGGSGGCGDHGRNAFEFGMNGLLCLAAIAAAAYCFGSNRGTV
jgi:hypothetical protein